MRRPFARSSLTPARHSHARSASDGGAPRSLFRAPARAAGGRGTQGEKMTALVRTFDPKVKVVLDSISPHGIRLPTVQFRQPRMIHADFLTHRVFSRNGRSSRAVPVVTLLEEAKNPYVPRFLKNKPGMTATEEFSDEERALAEAVWRDMADYTRKGVERLNAIGVHKQWANRPLEWFGYIDVLVTSTEWNNYLALRDHEAAQPEIQQIAQAIRDALDASTPIVLQPGQWHLPYIEPDDYRIVLDYLRNGVKINPTPERQLEILKKISAARCARLTIKPFDGDGSFEKELERYKNLIESRPVHASPVEHQATPDTGGVMVDAGHGPDKRKNRWHWDNRELHGNFRGWIQNRKTVPNEWVPG
ncbi:MAG: thymidylate synthase [Mesorhizobium sp.]|nr:MAG: thymidylate synthase [Mesorhizobium sp.]